jgi:myosin heavy subunit
VVAIQQWESRCDALYQKIEELELELEDYETNQAIGTLKHQLDTRTEELCKLKLAFDNIVIKEKKLTEDLQISQQSCANLQSIRDERDNLLSGKRSIEDEIERLHSAISELEQTHQDQNKLIQEMKDAQATNERALKEEREGNKILKEEFKKLRDDFALVLGHNEQDPFGFHVEKVTSSAAINIMEKERKEINSLRKSLRNLQEELNSSHQKNREVQIKLSDTLQLLTSYEKEICSVKSEIEILQLTLESENRDHLKQRSELEQRIRHLEKDRHKLNSSYIANIENLRNDLSSVKAERDRLIYALEESERMNSTWVNNSSISSEAAPTNHIEAELSNFSAEKSKLLMTLSKQSSSVEKRIRSALSGDFHGDDVRKSEFTSLQDQFEKVNIEYEKAKSRNNELLSLVQDANKLKYENERLEQEVDDLLQEKSRIESAFTQKLSSSKDKFAELENRYNELQTNFRELQRVQKLKGSLSVDVEKDDIVVSDTDQQSYIDGLNTELKQSKSLYQDLWMEHEDLLALLAQQDCEKRCLEEALVKSEGHEALDRVMSSVQLKLQNELGIS